jgi:hypothetical protein
MKKLFVILFLAIGTTTAMAQDPVVIKQEGASVQQSTDEEEDVRNQTFKQRLRFGLGGLGFQFGTFFSSVSAAPMVGYMITNTTMGGLEVPYQHTWGRLTQPTHWIGYRGFVNQQIPPLAQLIGTGYGRLEYEQYNVISGGSNFSPRASILAGIGIGAFRGTQIIIMYDLNYQEGTSLYGSPLVVRGGITF